MERSERLTADVVQGSVLGSPLTPPSNRTDAHVTAAVEDPAPILRSAAAQLRTVADDLDGSVRSLSERRPNDETATRIVADAVTHLRLTAEAIEFVLG